MTNFAARHAESVLLNDRSIAVGNICGSQKFAFNLHAKRFKDLNELYVRFSLVASNSSSWKAPMRPRYSLRDQPEVEGTRCSGSPTCRWRNIATNGSRHDQGRDCRRST